MADVNRGGRPLSPHLQVYRMQWTMLLSITHRITGAGMMVGAVLVVWWLVAAATGPDYFAFVDGLMTSWIGTLVMIGSAWALFYHLANGLRHLAWDLGLGFDLPTAQATGYAAVAASVALTLLLILLA
ncbi:succinate dehydrogenase, cytochrome b556 subunit [Paralimibaculum aggregatum]|uniref:Succinate dehydrogenase cytochrome b556 subunit n=1 Tax=Paralimibaculum aggregatum TaxID=3036245 RepID=A0ABQ6LLY2_9RHOB|nr:succinate dehydrogenase, cytochrome b556 subunit [Limibaculum sp. NKW23]GMG83319.1 succinate dehydrogenase, cytochrome b556 subunit [Limibaculum sp. NKW23]